MGSIAEELRSVESELPDGVKLVAVSKFHPVEAVMEAYRAGQRRFGENRPQEMAAKAAVLPKDIEWHFVGTLQRNKIKMVLPYAFLIHSVDSLKLFEDIVKHAPSCCNGDRKKINVLLQLRIASEDTKQGFEEEEITGLLDRLSSLYDVSSSSFVRGEAAGGLDYNLVNICGLMGMASFVENPDSEEGSARLASEFGRAKALFDRIKSAGYPFLTDFTELSMGMTGDFHHAVKFGSTIVRIGTRIFGARDYSKK